MGIANTHLKPPVSTRKDLLAVGLSITAVNKGTGASQSWLRDLGFVITEKAEDHWILTHTSALPELHFYSEQELEQFARHRAHHYAKHSIQENLP
ncbi:hypothetical protein FWJ25_16720 [Marinobacter salinexigens]|uniref:Uncharacterized protein n=1 Tax=Marinobacter salinexigens TaxID=2919747 RepID=A0A5B0V9B7_9GAMM|nr:hypothetical protein [Marinobacter salinexigens]KAA1171266.1 hypothetical protein FWJ25_16720 [Marinobacter salinexigens]